jgi:hypothetical protein
MTVKPIDPQYIERIREILPEALNLRKFDILAVKQENQGHEVEFNDPSDNFFHTTLRILEMELYSAETGIEIHIKIPNPEFPEPKVTHPKKLLL